MARRPLKATDKRRNYARPDIEQSSRRDEGHGVGKPLANLFNDRRKGRNGSARRAD